MENKRKLWAESFLTLLLIAYFVFGFIPLNNFNAAKGVYHVLGFPFEAKIPFLSPFILGYALVYGSVLFIYWVIPSWAVFKKMAWGFFLVTTLHYIFFIVFPVRMIWRPEIVIATNFFERIAKLIFSVDKAYNCFPSLHVAYPTLATVLAWRFIPKYRYHFLFLALITAFSVVLVKQHYIVDAFAGAFVSVLVGVLIPR